MKEEIPGYTVAEAVKEARRCLNCPKPLCRTGCPIENEIPQFNHALAQGNIGEAYRIISQKSNLPAICGRVCPHENQCEGHCVLYKSGKGIKIGRIEKFIADFYSENQLSSEKLVPKTKGKVAVIGSGPAGLTVAGDLARKGYNVVVYEGESEPGGVLLYGIPDFRLPKEVVRREIKNIEALGVTFVCNTRVGTDITIDKMFEEGFEAVFIGAGTSVAKGLGIPGENLSEVPVEEGDRVIVIGAGNVAMDACRTAVMMKASSVVDCYRRTIEFMKAAHAEYDGAVKDGVDFRWEHTPIEVVGENGKVTGLKVSTPEGEKILPADKILIAVGSKPAGIVISSTTGIDVDESGYVITKQTPYGMTTKNGVFAGGDIVHKPATVVLAMREAKKVAQGIADYIEARKLLGV